MNTTLVTTSIPYVNARPHLGFALELVQADAMARSHRLIGDDVRFLTGTDENAIKNVVVARSLSLTPQALCDRNAAIFEALLGKLDISADTFIRTSSPRHHAGATKLWRACEADITRKTYAGRYCVGCEDFVVDRDLDDGKCPIHGTVAEEVEEENWFFRLSRYQGAVRDALSSDRYRVGPDTRRNEALAFVEGGLRDFSISRNAARSDGWGVPVPGDDSQTLYVWFDALTNYLNGVGYADDVDQFARYWTEADRIVHVIGKDVLKFHAAYWPGMLAAAGLRLPTDLHVHGFLTVDGRKIGKSTGNAVDPFPIVDRYGADALRYYLLRYVPSGADSDFSHAQFAEVYESDLANTLGNLVSRLETLAERAGLDRLPLPAVDDPADVDDRRFHVTLDRLWEVPRALNRSIEAERPWEGLRTGEKARVAKQLAGWIGELLVFAVRLSPFLPGAAEEIVSRFSVISRSHAERGNEEKAARGNGEIRRGNEGIVRREDVLFPRIISP